MKTHASLVSAVTFTGLLLAAICPVQAQWALGPVTYSGDPVYQDAGTTTHRSTVSMSPTRPDITAHSDYLGSYGPTSVSYSPGVTQYFVWQGTGAAPSAVLIDMVENVDGSAAPQEAYPEDWSGSSSTPDLSGSAPYSTGQSSFAWSYSQSYPDASKPNGPDNPYPSRYLPLSGPDATGNYYTVLSLGASSNAGPSPTGGSSAGGTVWIVFSNIRN